MNLSVLAALLLTPCTAFALQGAPTECTLDQVTYVTNDGAVYSIDPNSVFTMQHPGHLRARVAFTTTVVDPQTSLYAEPDMVCLWGIRNVNNVVVGKVRWMGDDEHQTVMPMLDFNPTTGAGHAQLDLPVAQFIGHHTYATFPQGLTKLALVLGEQGELDLDAAGNPVNYRWWSRYSLHTQYPDLLTAVEEAHARIGERVEVTVRIADPLPAASTLLLEVIGNASLTYAGTETNSWTVALPAEASVYGIDLVATGAGNYRVRATLNGALVAESQWCDVATYSEGVYLSAQQFAAGPNSGDPDNPIAITPSPIGSTKLCTPAACSSAGGDREMRCTGAFIEMLTTTPPNPDCPGPAVGIAVKGNCTAGDETCTYWTDSGLSCPKYEYAGTVDRSCGTIMVGVETGAGAEVSVKAFGTGGSATGHVDVQTQVESPVTRRCCKYTPAEGESVTISIRNCI